MSIYRHEAPLHDDRRLPVRGSSSCARLVLRGTRRPVPAAPLTATGRAGIPGRREDPYFAGLLRTVGTPRTISVGGRQYQLAPGAKTWVRTGRASGAAAAYGDQIINVLEPATLRKLLSTRSRKIVAPWAKNNTTGRKQQIYLLTGTIALKDLHRVSPSFREAAGTPAFGASEVTWTYMYDDRGWPYRVGWRFYAHPRPEVPGLGHDRILRGHLATQYWNWDRPMTITAPGAKPGRGLPVDDLTDVLSAPGRRE